MTARRGLKWTAAAALLLLIAGLAVPRFDTDRYRGRIQSALETALGRKVMFGELRFNLLTGPGFTLRDVMVAEDPALGAEPVAYVDSVVATPRLLSLLTGHLTFSSLRLEDAHLNLARADLPNGQYRWNVEALLRPALVAVFPRIGIHGARINFKAANVKNVVYLLDCDLAIEPPSQPGAAWRFRFEGKPARADRPARGSGLLRVRGAWKPGSLEGILQLERSELGDVIAVLRGEDAGLHGLISGNARFEGPMRHVSLEGQLRVEELHGWNQDIPKGEVWPLELQGWWNSDKQQLQLDARVTANGSNPLAVRYLVEKYLTQPKWGASVTLSRFPAAPLAQLARHMGLALAPGLELAGTLDGVIGYSVSTGYRGQARIVDAAVKLAGVPPLTAPEANVVVSDGIVTLQPARLLQTVGEYAIVEGSYSLATGSARVRVAARNLDVAAMGRQLPDAKIPVLSSARAGRWSGELEWTVKPPALASWTGDIQLSGLELVSPALAAPVLVDQAQCRIAAGNIEIDKLRGHLGGVAFTGEYRFQSEGAHPHRFRIGAGVVAAAELEALVLPSLRRPSGVLGVDLPFRKRTLPAWLAGWHAEGTVQIAALDFEEWQLPNLRAKMQWDAGRIVFQDVVSGNAAGRVAIDLHGREPVYRIDGRLRDQQWKGGHISLDATATGAGVGAKLLQSLEASGRFNASELDDNLDSITGGYDLAWRPKLPRLRVSGVRLQSAGDTYAGKGSLQSDGTLLLELTGLSKQARVSGPLSAEAPLRWLPAP